MRIGENMDLKKKVDKKRGIVADLVKAASLIENEIDHLITATIINANPMRAHHRIHSPFFWECEKSPFGWCTYDITTDPAMDNCIFCGEPYERK